MDQRDGNTTGRDRDLSSFTSHDQVTTKPRLPDLCEHFTPQYALKWKVIGTLLDLPSEELDIIEHDNFYQAKPCCNAMLKWWLQVDPTASWGKLFTVIESPAVSSSQAIYKVTTKPKLPDLCEYFTPQYALKWKVIGTLLGVASEKLDIIEHDNFHQAEPCCNDMLKWWLQVDPTASWGKLFTVIESPAVSSSQAIYKGDDAVISKLAEMVSQSNVQEQFNIDEETWPPDQPKNFIPLVLIHHHGKYSIKETTEIAQLIQKHGIDEITSLASNKSAPKHHQYPKLNSREPLQEVSLDRSTVTEELTEILAPLEQSEGPQFVLIEGAPGIGKSVLLKEIAYRWGKRQLLKIFKLVLLICLRDPTVQQAVSVSDLLQHFCEGNKRAAELAAACLSKNGGKDLMFLFDGFDELHTELRKSSLISKILDRKLLRNCTLVVSSRPHATAHLRTKATVRIDILGFSEVQRNQFIQQALEEQPQKSKELTQYLEDHLTISSLCVVPFNMVALLYLYKLGISLPNNSTGLYNDFICQTIYRHLAKDGHSLNNVNITANLTNLPEPCNKIIQQLSKFSLKALNDNMLVFTFDEIKNACPNIVSIPGTINGFGLLKAIEHYDINGKGTTITFNFLHFSIQEFLAAHHVANLPPHDELKILREKFWSDIHSNMFAIYVSLTKGQRPSFKQFIKPSLGQRLISFLTGTQVANRFVDDQVKCFRLFRCFFEAGDKDVCRSIENATIFNSKRIIIQNSSITTLSASDIVCLAIFLTCSSHKEWDLLHLNGCYIQDHGVRILHHELTSCKLTITTLNLIGNGLTESCSPAIIDIIISCRVKNLWIDGNNINICESEKLNSLISDPSSTLEGLSITNTHLSSLGAIKLFTALSEITCKLRCLYLDYNNNLSFSDKVCDAMVMAMKKNTSLKDLAMYGIPISLEHIQLIIQALQHNNTLQVLHLENINADISKLIILYLVKKVNIIREDRGCETTLVVSLRKIYEKRAYM